MGLHGEHGPPLSTGGPGSPHPGEDATLLAIAEAAREWVPGIDHVGISVLDREGRIDTRAATSGLVRDLDALQRRLGEGPCLDIARGARMVTVSRLPDDPRWRSYVQVAAAVGLRAQLVLEVPLEDRDAVAALNLSSAVSEDIHPDAEPVARLFAGHAAIALGSLRDRSAGLPDALRAREVVGLATGIIADRYDMSPDRAFAFMVRAASNSDMLVREVAQELVDRHSATTSLGRA